MYYSYALYMSDIVWFMIDSASFVPWFALICAGLEV